MEKQRHTFRRAITTMIASIAAICCMGSMAVAASAAPAKRGLLGIIDEYGSQSAKDVLQDPIYQHWDQLGLIKPADSDNSFNLANVRKAVTIVEQTNERRRTEGLSDLKISDASMVVAAGNNEYTVWMYTHTKQYGHTGDTDNWGMAENISQMGSDSVRGWFDWEKPYFDNYVTSGNYPGLAEHKFNAYWVYQNYPDIYQVVGHYLNIIEQGRDIIGAAYAGDTEQNFANSNSAKLRNSKLYTVSEFNALIDKYVAEHPEENTTDGNESTDKPTTPDKPTKPNKPGNGTNNGQNNNQSNGGTNTNKPSNTSKVPVYRVYNPYSGFHHYTTNAGEAQKLVQLGWHDEGVAFNAAPSNSANARPVYREYNPNSGQHNWTLNGGEHRQLVSIGWNDEGIAWYTNPSASVTVYRLYNPNTGEHLYSINQVEYEGLGRVGWHQEGVAWKGL